MEPEKKDKKDRDDLDLSELFGSAREIHVTGASIVAGGESVSATIERVPLKRFIERLRAISERHPDRRGQFGRFLAGLFRTIRPFKKISSMGELKDMLNILTNKDFYKTASREREEKYIRIILEYLVRKSPRDYQYLLKLFVPNISSSPVIPDYQAQIEQHTKLIMQRLAGDTTTDAPLPEKKKKPKGK